MHAYQIYTQHVIADTTKYTNRHPARVLRSVFPALLRVLWIHESPVDRRVNYQPIFLLWGKDDPSWG